VQNYGADDEILLKNLAIRKSKVNQDTYEARL